MTIAPGHNLSENLAEAGVKFSPHPSTAGTMDWVLTKFFGMGLLLASIVLVAASLYFIATHPAASPTLTVPLVLVFVVLGVLRWRWQVVLFVFLTPLIYWLPSSQDGDRLALIRMLFPLVLLPWAARIVLPSARLLPSNALRRPLFYYCAVVLLSAVIGIWRYFPLASWGTINVIWNELVEANRVTVFAYFRPAFCIARETLVYLSLPLFYLLLLHLRDRSLLRSLRLALVSSAVLASSVALVEKIAGGASAKLAVVGRPELQRVSGTLGDPNTFGGFLALSAGLVALTTVHLWQHSALSARTVGTRSLLRVVSLVPAALVLLALIWTTSRAAWLGLGAGSILVGLFMARTTRRSLDRFVPRASIAFIVALSAAVVAGLFMFGAWYSKDYSQWGSAGDVFWSLFSHDLLGRELWVRWVWWSGAFQMGADSPATGVGVGAFRFFIDQYWPSPGNAAILSEPHNYYLKVFSELGLPGLLLFAWVCILVWRSGRDQVLDRSRDTLERVAARAGLLALAVHMIFQHSLVQIEMQIATATVMALALAGAPSTGRSSSLMPQVSPWWRFTEVSVLVAALGFLAWRGAYRGNEPLVVPSAVLSPPPSSAAVGSEACLGRGERLEVETNLQLGRVLVLVPARSASPGPADPTLTLWRNEHPIARWTVSDRRKVYAAGVFTRPGVNTFQLRHSGVGTPTSPDKCFAYVERIAIVPDHMATYFLALGNPDAADRTLSSVAAK